MMMMNNIALAFFASTIMLSSNMLNHDLRSRYELETSKSWAKLTFFSWLLGGLDGSLTAYMTTTMGYPHDVFYLTVLASVVSYLALQMLYTDIAILQGDRWSLRIGYIITVALAFMYAITQYSGFVRQFEIGTLIGLLFMIFLLFLFSSMGASDIRALAVMFPLPMVINTSIAAYTFFGVLLFTAIVQITWQRQAKAKIPVPILPFFLLPYVFIVPLFSYLVNLLSASTLR